ncbi:hypothetical protein DEU56DRAFT_55930 [Suillus clintonianus]|uniref:uncharacterized protein n=1 Tax=Suillus clintonianus TaxID=1904413 RepID=UPI001B880E94|nr:uncharacterized protein DEU56DRAFT_55930 [Suillus clintonianus]KAG2149205.1 hypothetical protein DEU56DRAFT_55930 [Suillus clintonianus]
MGAGQSKADTEEKVFYNETPIQFSQDVVNHLSDTSMSPDISLERQSTLDAHVRARIQAELEHLRAEEESVQKEIELALERENIDRDMTSTLTGGESSDEVDVKNSVTLMGDLEEIRTKVDRFQARRQLSDYPAVKESGEAVVFCYKQNPSTPLDCWREVREFNASVTQAESQHLASLR